MKKILIIGRTSYIGRNLKKWLDSYSQKYDVDVVSARNGEWENIDFGKYQIIVNLAGIAHINNVKKNMRNLFYCVNRDLVIRIALKAKKQGVHQFIHFSSMNVYGDICNNIQDRNDVNPTSFYGDSKLQGDIELKKLESSDFLISYIRPPFVYGKECSGNYNIISRIAKKTPFFPKYKNKKSMIYIENLCEFVRLVIENELDGYLTPQNKELVSTSELVRQIAGTVNHKIYFTNMFNWAIWGGNKLISKVKRAFGNDYYDLSLSEYFNFEYCIVDFEESIRKTEGN